MARIENGVADLRHFSQPSLDATHLHGSFLVASNKTFEPCLRRYHRMLPKMGSFAGNRLEMRQRNEGKSPVSYGDVVKDDCANPCRTLCPRCGHTNYILAPC
eukprot:scaffold4278_cov173-Amphora_coffeaeformis.AAC.15